MNPIKGMIQKRKNNPLLGIASYCTANELVIEALLLRAKQTGQPVLIEATANQVNQYGGYTGMKPADFSSFVLQIAERVNCPQHLVLLGGDHLGPLTFHTENEAEAMEKSKELVRQYVQAGFIKIHLDTSMKLGSDSAQAPLLTETIAQRGVALYATCIDAFNEMPASNKVRPVFIIGSEVPIPGGATEAEETIQVTKTADFKATVDTYRRVFAEHGYPDAFEDIIAVVVQPGVEFGDSQVFLYNEEKAGNLCAALAQYEDLVFEGHSTDYQPLEYLKAMVQDGVAILKVGPALTFRLREALYALSMMERELVPQSECSNFMQVLDSAMVQEPKNWQNHYHGSEHELQLARQYSFSDRCRYYLNAPGVQKAIETLLNNLAAIDIPMNILHQYMPAQYEKVVRNALKANGKALLFDAVLETIQVYEHATGHE